MEVERKSESSGKPEPEPEMRAEAEADRGWRLLQRIELAFILKVPIVEVTVGDH